MSCLGHGHPDVLAAMHAQIDQLAYAHTSFFTTQVAEELADDLVAHAPPGIGHVYFVCGGSEAIEAALKMARQYFVETGAAAAPHFIARRQSYHGNTLGALAVGGNAWRRKQFAPLLIDVTHVVALLRISRPARRRNAGALRRAPGAGARGRDPARSGRENVIAFVAETVGGATLGAVPPVPGYFKRVREICDRHGILLILDEVMCGMGRTGTLHACEQEGIVARPDGDRQGPRRRLPADRRGAGAARSSTPSRRAAASFQHGHTYLGHPLACAAALAVQQVIRARRPARQGAARRARACASGSQARFGNTRMSATSAAAGCSRRIELVDDRATQARRSTRRCKLHARIKARGDGARA